MTTKAATKKTNSKKTGKSLVIVESPAKARTINRYLGKEYIVASSVGHVRDLPTSRGRVGRRAELAGGKSPAELRKMTPEARARYRKKRSQQQVIARIGIDPNAGWKANYEVLPDKEKTVAELKKLARDADVVYLATDLDREGEAIAWHLSELIREDAKKFYRIIFNEITKNAISRAIENPEEININRVNAQQARRFLDRVVGFMLSPLLWKKVARGLSAGRVQSVAVRLIVEREREISAFVPKEYWELRAKTKTLRSESLLLEVKKCADKAFAPKSEAETLAALEELREADFEVTSCQHKPGQNSPPPPLTTSTLQQGASARLFFGVKKTMILAQRLYEAGHITYMRTDSTHLSADAVAQCRDFIQESYKEPYLPEKPRFYASKAGAQEAHEAIRPSDVRVRSERLQGKGIDADAARLYEFIWRQFVACQMSNSEHTSTRFDVSADKYLLRASGRVMRFDGFTRVLPPLSKKDADPQLPDVAEGERLSLEELLPSQHFTKPPPRYSEASLVRELDNRGIGRPSTYASIISTIQERGYVSATKRRFFAEKIGDIVTSRLLKNFSDLMDYQFTAKMESDLDKVADGGLDWKQLLDIFYASFTEKLEVANADEGGMRPNEPIEVSIKCAKCGRNMMLRIGSTGPFLGCSGYMLEDKKQRCKHTHNIMLKQSPEVEPPEAGGNEDSSNAELLELRGKRRCKTCHSAMEQYLVDTERLLHVCGNYPDCPTEEIEYGSFKLPGYDGPTLECDKCNSEMILKDGRFGKYFDCSNEDCSNTRKLLKSGEAAPPKMTPVDMPELLCQKVNDHYVLRDGVKGLFLAASQFPKHRETRAPLLAELLPHREQIDPKYAYIMAAPVEDDEGRPTVVRFDSRTRLLYVRSEEEGKNTGWEARLNGDRWVCKKAKRRSSRTSA